MAACGSATTAGASRSDQHWRTPDSSGLAGSRRRRIVICRPS